MTALTLAARLVELASKHGDVEVLIPTAGIPDLQVVGFLTVFDGPAHIDAHGKAVRERATTNSFVVLG